MMSATGVPAVGKNARGLETYRPPVPARSLARISLCAVARLEADADVELRRCDSCRCSNASRYSR